MDSARVATASLLEEERMQAQHIADYGTGAIPGSAATLGAGSTAHPTISLPDEETPVSPSAVTPGGTKKKKVAVPDTLALKVSRVLLIITYILVAVAIGFTIYELVQVDAENHVVAWAVAGIAVIIAVPLSIHDIHMHISHYVAPHLQRYYIRILWMVPIYAIESWCALRFRSQKIYLETMREAYEAYVIYSFFMLLYHYLGPKEKLLTRLRSDGRASHTKMIFPLCCLPQLERGKPFLRRTTFGVLQYVFIRFTSAIIVLILEHFDLYGEGEWHTYDAAYVYFLVIINLSQFWAMYCLVLFYHEFKKDLAPIRPFGKFVTVKAVVFFSFWQGIIISGLVSVHVIEPTLTYSEDDVAKGLQDFLICIEMALAAIAHKYAFSYTDFFREELAHVHTERNADGTPMYKHHGIGRALVDLIPVDIVIEAGKHASHSLGLSKSTRRVPQTVVVKETPTLSPITEGDASSPSPKDTKQARPLPPGPPPQRATAAAVAVDGSPAVTNPLRSASN